MKINLKSFKKYRSFVMENVRYLTFSVTQTETDLLIIYLFYFFNLHLINSSGILNKVGGWGQGFRDIKKI